METVDYKNINITVWDVGGRDKIVCTFLCALLCTPLSPQCDHSLLGTVVVFIINTSIVLDQIIIEVWFDNDDIIDKEYHI